MDNTLPQPARIDILGFSVHPGTLQDYLDLAGLSVRQNLKTTVFYHNLHSLYSYFRSPELQRQYENKTVLVDGMPLIWLLQAAGHKVTRDDRVTYVDFIMPLMQLAAENQWNVYHLGQTSEIQARAMQVIREQCPGLNINGRDGYFDQSSHSEGSLAVINDINESECDILLVGFGAPRQEDWVHTHRDLIKAPIVFTCGACMEYVAGSVRTPPRWMGRLGLEWSFRLLENPRRFAFRYFVEPVLLAAMLCRQALRPRLTGEEKGRSSHP